MAARSSSVLPGNRNFSASIESTPSSCMLRTTILLFRMSSVESSKTFPVQRQETFVLPSGINPVTPGGITPDSSVAESSSCRTFSYFAFNLPYFSCALTNSSTSSKSSGNGGCRIFQTQGCCKGTAEQFLFHRDHHLEQFAEAVIKQTPRLLLRCCCHPAIQTLDLIGTRCSAEIKVIDTT